MGGMTGTERQPILAPILTLLLFLLLFVLPVDGLRVLHPTHPFQWEHVLVLVPLPLPLPSGNSAPSGKHSIKRRPSSALSPAVVGHVRCWYPAGPRERCHWRLSPQLQHVGSHCSLALQLLLLLLLCEAPRGGAGMNPR